MKSFTIEDLEEALDDVLPDGFVFETNDSGQIVIVTNLTEDEDGRLIPVDSDDSEDYDEDCEEYDDEKSYGDDD